MGELSATSGLPVATIKYYLREGLLAPGARTAANQADYDQGHLHRLRLIRALIEVGDLPLATVRQVLAAAADPHLAVHDLLGVVHHALALRGMPPGRGAGQAERAEQSVDRFLDHLGWTPSPTAPARAELAGCLATLWGLGWEVDAQVFSRYAQLADQLAGWELSQIPAGGDRGQAVEATVVGTVVFEAALVALRRLAQEHHSARHFGAEQDPGAAPDASAGQAGLR